MFCEYLVFEEDFCLKKRLVFRPFCHQAPSRDVRVSLLDTIITEILAHMSLDDKQDLFGWRYTSYGFYLRHAARSSHTADRTVHYPQQQPGVRPVLIAPTPVLFCSRNIRTTSTASTCRNPS